MADSPAERRAAIHVRDVLDTLWLAAWLSESTPDAGTATRRGSSSERRQPPTDAAGSTTSTSADVGSPDAGAPGSTAATSETTPGAGGLYAPGAGPREIGEGSIRARPLRIPAGSALPNSLPIVRALRPIPARMPSRVELELDETATVEASAHGHGVTPVLRPRLERWFDAVLVVDHSASAEIWAQTVIEIERMLAFCGTFRDVRTFRLEQAPSLRLLNESGVSVRPSTLNDPTARRIIFVFSPGVSGAWTDGRWGRVVGTWGASTPVVLLHALPAHLWERTALGEPLATVTNETPGGPNTGLKRHLSWRVRPRRVADRHATLPVLALEPESARRWAQMMAARRGGAAPAFLVRTTPLPPRPAGAGAPRGPSVAERVELFRVNAPDAFRLAVRLAAGPFTMPILQLVQSSLFGRDARHSQIAEVMLSGLVARVSPMDAPVPAEQVQFQFAAEAATLLLQSLRRDDAREMTALLQG
jgi:hypothetical protein